MCFLVKMENEESEVCLMKLAGCLHLVERTGSGWLPPLESEEAGKVICSKKRCQLFVSEMHLLHSLCTYSLIVSKTVRNSSMSL